MVVYESLKLLDPMNYRYHTRFIIAQSNGYVPESRLRGEATIRALLDRLAAALHLPRGKLVAGSFGW